MRFIKFLLVLPIVYMCINAYPNETAIAENNIVHTTITMDETYIYALSKTGDVYCWDYSNGLYKIIITGNAIEISKNYVIKDDGTLWCWDSEFNLEYIDDSVRAVNAGAGHALYIKYDGSLWGIGDNSCGQLGQGTLYTDNGVQIGDDTYTRENIHHVKYIPEYYSEPVKIMDNVKKAEAGMSHSMVLTADGSVYTFGSELYGELADNRDIYINKIPNLVLEDICDIFSSGAACFAIDEHKNSYRWGSNYVDFMGSISNVTKPVRYSENTRYIWNKPGYNYVIDTASSLWILGDTEDEGRIQLSDLTMLNVPVKILDNVDCVIGTDRSEYYDITVVLTLNGDLYLIDRITQDENKIYNPILTLLNKNIRLSEENPANKEFYDLDSCSDEEKQSIKSLYVGGVIQGMTDTAFMPDKTISRAETAALLLRIIGKENEAIESDFSDVSKDNWYYNVVGVSQKYGIIDGYDDNTFRGEEAVSSLQLAVLAARTLKNEGTAIEPETKTEINVPENIPDWAQEDILFALEYGLITDEEAGTLSDKGMTRGEAAVILYRLYCII